MTAPTRLPVTFVGGSLDGRWSYLPQGAPEYRSLFDVYQLKQTVWHSVEDDVMSHQVYEVKHG